MKILSLYNTPIKLEEGDLIAIDKTKKILWIRINDQLYTTIEPKDKLNLKNRLYVNSAGYYSRDKSILPDNLKWRKYNPIVPKMD